MITLNSNPKFEKKAIEVTKELWRTAPKFMAIWINKLKSGKYDQCAEYLFNNGSYCCLGVACKVNNIADSLISFEPIIDIGVSHRLPKAFNSYAFQTYLSNANNSDESFEKIASFLEQFKPSKP